MQGVKDKLETPGEHSKGLHFFLYMLISFKIFCYENKLNILQKCTKRTSHLSSYNIDNINN